jgi:hypothetical protein
VLLFAVLVFGVWFCCCLLASSSTQPLSSVRRGIIASKQ